MKATILAGLIALSALPTFATAAHRHDDGYDRDRGYSRVRLESSYGDRLRHRDHQDRRYRVPEEDRYIRRDRDHEVHVRSYHHAVDHGDHRHLHHHARRYVHHDHD